MQPTGTKVVDETFRAVLGRFATGVTVMTTVVDGVPHGMTANAVSSVSLDPPLVLVCVERGTVMARRVVDGGVFALSFLTVDQVGVSARFADPTRPLDGEQFVDVAHRTATTGAPVLDGTLAWLDCRVWAVHDGGDHLIVVGEVVDLAVGADEDPLLYFRSGYGRLTGADGDAG